MNKINPLIICGGNGTRLWPVSRTQSPKQFQRIGDDDSPTFFQAAVQRHIGPGYHRPCIVSALRHRDTVAAQLREIGSDARVIHEPMGRNTGPAVLAAAIVLHAQDPEAIMLVVPADHVIEGDLDRTILAMRGAAQAGRIITFGIKPRHAETGFGYIADAGPMPGFPGLRGVERFVEKPPLREATALVESGTAYWASGLSLFAARTLIEEYERFDPQSASAVRRAVIEGALRADGLELAATPFAEAAAEPTESLVFERTSRIALAPLDVEWNDVGCWTAMYGISKSNPQGNVLQGDVIAVDTKNSMVRSSSRLVTLVGLEDVIVIDTPDALLVTRVGHCQSVKKVAEYLKVGNRIEAESHRPLRLPQTDAAHGIMSPVFQSDSIELVSVSIAPGTSLRLDPVNSRQVTVSRGRVMVTALASGIGLAQGERMDLASQGLTVLSNPSTETAEVLLLTLLGSQSASVKMPQQLPHPPSPQPLYA